MDMEEKIFDVVIPVEYACVPPGFPASWDKNWVHSGVNFFQTFIPRGTHLYGLSLFHKPSKKPEANRFQMMLHEDRPEGPVRYLKDAVSPDPGWSGKLDRVAAEKGDSAVLRAGWRHGDMPVKAGRTYAIRAEAHRSHGGVQYKLAAYVRPDNGDGYGNGQAFVDGRSLGGDLCCLVFGDSHGQYVENQIRAEDWEIFLPRHRPSRDWGQSFLAHGASLAGVSFWAASHNTSQVMCEVRVREDGPWGRIIKPVKVARSCLSAARPRIVYPEIPAPLQEYRSYYDSSPKLFQAAYLPDEVKLTPGRTYYIQLLPTKPLILYADGHFYQHGHAYYEGLKVERQELGQRIFHSKRWTLLMNIVTYANPGGRPLSRIKLGESQ